MYVCHCRVVTDRDVIAAIESGAATVRALARHCGAGGRCGGCLPELARLLAAHRDLEIQERETPGGTMIRRALPCLD
jgi:bacterioferritin-associated ferredoxin